MYLTGKDKHRLKLKRQKNIIQKYKPKSKQEYISDKTDFRPKLEEMKMVTSY
jgi:hypothetical protein